ncbi:hypothetical protein QYE76_061715 [Lolium multiflorum]|uniref:Uncharacterized protein n=1 Tax=Lolium multiflorum TaxID=4521 RepID=A0AAD8W6K8_LOLMU|nr:hypothetical protein QYE76_061715 [Lolium multiflorum]
MSLKPASAQSPPPAVSPRNKRKRDDAEESGTSKVEEAVPSHQKAGYDPYLEALISSDDEEEVPTLMWLLERSFFASVPNSLGTVITRKPEEKLAEANERADTLAQKLEQCEEARKKAESDAVEARQEADKAKADAAGVEDLRNVCMMPRLR